MERHLAPESERTDWSRDLEGEHEHPRTRPGPYTWSPRGRHRGPPLHAPRRRRSGAIDRIDEIAQAFVLAERARATGGSDLRRGSAGREATTLAGLHSPDAVVPCATSARTTSTAFSPASRGDSRLPDQRRARLVVAHLFHRPETAVVSWGWGGLLANPERPGLQRPERSGIADGAV